MQRLSLFVPVALLAVFLLATTSCFSGEESSASRGSDGSGNDSAGVDPGHDSPADDDTTSGDDDASQGNDDDAGDDDDSGDDDDVPDDDDFGDDDDDVIPPWEENADALNYGIVHFHYYYDLGGYEGEIFQEDTAWAAENVDLAIINYNDEGTEMAWEALRNANPQGSWLKWDLAHLFLTNESSGSCADPIIGEKDQTFDARVAEFGEFLNAYPQHGDGESCFLHAKNDGLIEARWHAHGCWVELWQKGYQGSAATMTDARIKTLVWDEYVWLIDITSGCGKDYNAWRAKRAVEVEGFGGVGYDNIGGPIEEEDSYYLPNFLTPNDVLEIPNDVEANWDKMNDWWLGGVRDLMAHIRFEVQKTHSEARFVFNSGAYCSWDGSVDMVADLASKDVGPWCESALHHPDWGNLNTPDRMRSIIDTSEKLAAEGSFLALETFYNGGSSNPDADELMFYLAAYYMFRNGRDVFVIKPAWNPYEPLKDSVWFGIFEKNIGEPAGPAWEQHDGIFRRRFEGLHGTTAEVVVRMDGQRGGVDYSVGSGWCALDANGDASAAPATVWMNSGDALILVPQSSGAC
ncbi:hypothetical protein K8I61_12880 [bacterium]|nr:hypothetical protein [bacterium]